MAFSPCDLKGVLPIADCNASDHERTQLPQWGFKGGERCGVQLLDVFEAVEMQVVWNSNATRPFHNRGKCIYK